MPPTKGVEGWFNPHDIAFTVLNTIEGAAALREFIIRVTHPDLEHASKINLRLRVKCVHYKCAVSHPCSNDYIRFPKTYPRLACPTFSIEKPWMGITESQVVRLSQEINSEAQKLRGFEMVFTASIAQHFALGAYQIVIDCNIRPRLDFYSCGSAHRGGWFACCSDESEGIGRTTSEFGHSFSKKNCLTLSEVRQQREEEEAERAEEIATRAALELDEQIQADAMRQMLAKEQQYKSRKRANSETTEVPPTFDCDSDTMKEAFQHIDINGIRFDTVRLFHPRPGTFPFESLAQVISMFDSPPRIGVYGRASSGRHHSCQPSRAFRRHI